MERLGGIEDSGLHGPRLRHWVSAFWSGRGGAWGGMEIDLRHPGRGNRRRFGSNQHNFLGQLAQERVNGNDVMGLVLVEPVESLLERLFHRRTADKGHPRGFSKITLGLRPAVKMALAL